MKKTVQICVPLVGAMLLASPAFALEVVESKQVDATPEKTWSAVGDFCAIAEWHPAVTKCEESEADGTTQRTLTLDGGGELVEQLVERDDDAMRYTYKIVSGPLPVKDYESTISVSGNDNLSTIAWEGSFDAADGASDADAENVIRGIYTAGLDGIAKRAAGM
ncbi:SRPBCC family protein [Fulvimarina endophytica]|uniref:SRPBCC family protein n=1 Tax=Fulvimarina endophytica TaxID=2293836 RepID=A0A371XA08_9HYPH|nr:SRPBCC family protein [Fulvimarina endophytica]RFC66060.1 SRPBCC family protein [Fulvimarina endophytica]